MYKQVLVPLDGSKLAEKVLPYARLLAASLALPLELLYVNDVEITASTAYGRHGSDYLNDVATTFPASLGVNCRIETGKPAEVIVDSAARDPHTLIAMATHGCSGAQRWLLGSVAEKVLQASGNPVLLVRPEEKLDDADARFNTIIAPLDGSHLAEKIFPHVVYLAAHFKVEVVLMRSYALPTSSYYMTAGIPPLGVGEIAANIRGEIDNYLKAKAEQLAAEGVEKVTCLALEGNAPEEIVDLARKTKHSLLAMCSHGRSGIGRWVLGSVTNRVVSYSGNPVLVIRSRASEGLQA